MDVRCLRYVDTFREDFAHPEVDLIVIGEGVDAIREICDVRERGSADYSHIPGLALVQADGRIVRTAPRPLPKTLDDYPLPDRSLTRRYRKKYFYLYERSVAAVRTSFGCTHHCTFCSVRVYSEGRFVCRSARSVFEEICGLDEPFVMFCDDHSFLDAERMRELARLLLEAGVKKRYFAYARADSIVSHPDVFELWAEAGLTLVMSGFEALDDLALKRAGKRTSADLNERALQIAEEAGFWLSAGFLVEPDFGREDFEKIDRYVEARPAILLTEYTPLTPFPRTPLYRQIGDQLLTHEPHLFDLQHFVLPTRLPARELYGLQLEYYQRSIKRVVRHLFRHSPSQLFSLHTVKLLWGLLRNARAYRSAHLQIPDRRPLPSPGEEEPAAGASAS